jgi:hypothetical protein
MRTRLRVIWFFEKPSDYQIPLQKIMIHEAI